MKINLCKSSTGIVAADQDSRRAIEGLELGVILEAEVKKDRKPKFHRKFFSMLNFAYEQYRDKTLYEHREIGETGVMTFEKFREKVMITAGHYTETYGLDGEVSISPKSLSYKAADQKEMEQYYEDCCRVVLQLVLTNWRRSDLDRAIQQLFVEDFCG